MTNKDDIPKESYLDWIEKVYDIHTDNGGVFIKGEFDFVKAQGEFLRGVSPKEFVEQLENAI